MEANEFWRLNDYLRNDFVRSQHWSDEKWKSTMARGGGRKDFNIVLIHKDKKFFISELFKVIQDAFFFVEDGKHHHQQEAK